MVRCFNGSYAAHRAVGVCLFGLLLAGSACAGAPDPEVSVVMTDYGFEPSRFNVDRGKKTVLVLQNKGAEEHNLVLKQQNAASPKVAPGQTVRFEVTLPPGTFPIICNIPGHEEAGMVGQIVSARGR